MSTTEERIREHQENAGIRLARKVEAVGLGAGLTPAELLLIDLDDPTIRRQIEARLGMRIRSDTTWSFAKEKLAWIVTHQYGLT